MIATNATNQGLRPARETLAFVYGALLIIPFFLDVGPDGLSLPRSVFQPRQSAWTQTLPIGLFASAALCTAIGARALIRTRLQLRAPKRLWVLAGLWLGWLFTLSLAASSRSVTPVLFAIQASLPLLAFFASLHLVRDSATVESFVRGLVVGLGVTVWVHFAGFVSEVGWGAALGSRMTAEVWGFNIYQAYNYYPVVLACVFLIMFARETYLYRSAVRFVSWTLLFFVPTTVMLALLAVRGPILMVVLGVLIVLGLQWRRSYPRLAVFAGTACLLVGLLATAVAYLATHPEVKVAIVALDRIQAAVAAQDLGATTTFRVPMLRDAAEVFVARWYSPLVGTMMHPPTEAYSEVTFNWTSTHNFYVDQLVWGGLPALTLVVWLIVEVLCRLWRGYAYGRNAALRAISLGAIVTWLLVILISSNFRVPLRQPYPGSLLWSLAGVVIGTSPAHWGRRKIMIPKDDHVDNP